MFSTHFKENNEFVYNFFDSAIKNKTKSALSHAFIFEGNCPYLQYYSAITLAKLLNCKGDKTKSCTCVNCNWINQNKHPEIISITPIDYTYGNEKSKAKSVISINQIRYLKEYLSKTSEYKRVVIFSGAKELDKDSLDYNREKEKQAFYNITPPANDKEERYWALDYINSSIFQSSSANAILKLLEEPPSNVIFIFIARDKNDLIPTIISRCQNIKFPYIKESSKQDTQLIDFFKNINIKNYKDVIVTSENFIEFSKEHNTSLNYLLSCYENYLGKNIPNNKNKITPLAKILEKINTAKKELNAKVNIQSTLENLFESFL